MSLEQKFLIDCIENICSVVDQDPAEQVRNVFRLIQDYKQNVPQKAIKIKKDYLEDNLQLFVCCKFPFRFYLVKNLLDYFH